jgi:hypothetical protein
MVEMTSQTFEEKTQGLMAQFAERLAHVDLKHAVAVPAFLGAVAAIAGVGIEVQGQADLISHAGAAALDAYRAAGHASGLDLTHWLKEGLAGDLHTFGGNMIARSVAFMAAAPAVSLAITALARGFTHIRDALLLTDKEAHGQHALQRWSSDDIDAVDQAGEHGDDVLPAPQG